MYEAIDLNDTQTVSFLLEGGFFTSRIEYPENVEFEQHPVFYAIKQE